MLNSANLTLSCHSQDDTLRHKILCMCRIPSPLGNLMAIADEEALLMLAFTDGLADGAIVKKFVKKTSAIIQEGGNPPLQSIKNEIDAYFSGVLRNFKTPLKFIGTPFQQSVWQALIKIPFGKTISYEALALHVFKPKAQRAVALANAANWIPIVVPCHRVIRKSGNLGGYAGGISKKEFLIEHENKYLMRKS